MAMMLRLETEISILVVLLGRSGGPGSLKWTIDIRHDGAEVLLIGLGTRYEGGARSVASSTGR